MTTPPPVPDAPDGPVPELWVEKLALGELSAAETEAVRARLGDQAPERLAALARSNEEILGEHPPAEVAASIERRLARLDEEAKRRRSWGGPLAWAPLAVAAGVALVWWVSPGDPADPGLGGATGGDVIARSQPPAVPDPRSPGADGPEQILLKGDPVLMVDRIEAGRPQRMASDAPVAAGDLLQVTYNAKGAQQGVVVSIDGAGVATLHFPEAEADSPRLGHGGPVPLAQSYELDDAPDFERFFFVTVDAAQPRLDVARVVDAARRLATTERADEGALELPEGWRQQSIVLRK